MANGVQSLPPKLLQDYERKARNNEADKVSDTIHIFFVPPRQEITIILCGPVGAVGHFRKMNQEEWDRRLS